MSESRSVAYVKMLIPPLVISLFRKNKKYGWKGDYKSWQEAQKLSSGYDNSLILQKVKLALDKVKNGKAAYERDSVLFDQIHYSWPLLSALLWISLQNGGFLKVADFGGSLGSSYFQNKLYLDKLPDLKWNIVEQPNFVQCGKQFFQNDILRFYYTPEEMIAHQGLSDVLLLSCVLPYLEKPYETLKNLIQLRFPYILVDNTYFNYEKRDRICIQRVSPEIYIANYPCWMLNEEHVKTVLATEYQLISTHENESHIFLDGKKIQYRGFLFKIKK